VLEHRALPVGLSNWQLAVSHWLILFLDWHRLLYLWLVFLFLIPRFSAVGDFGQEFADALDVGVSPDMHRHAATGKRLRAGHLSNLNVVSKRGMGYA